MYLLVGAVLAVFFAIFLRLINLASRRREYRADELACLIAGSRPCIDGLRAVHGATPPWLGFWHSEVVPLIASGVVPAVVEGFARFTSVPAVGQQIRKDLDARIRDEKGNALNTHPPLRDRIAAAENGSVLNTEPGVFNLSRGPHHLDPFRLVETLRTGTLSPDDWRALCATLGIGDLDLGQAASERTA